MRSVNKVILMGNLAADPEVKSTQTGKMLAQFAVATNNVWRDESGEKKTSADFHRVVTWQSQAELCQKFLKKGSPVYVEGRIHNRSFEDKEKKRHYITEITADVINFISTKNSQGMEQVMLHEEEDTVAA